MEIEYSVDKIKGLKDERWLYAFVEVSVSQDEGSGLPAFELTLELPLPQDFNRSIEAVHDLALAAARTVVNEAALAALIK